MTGDKGIDVASEQLLAGMIKLVLWYIKVSYLFNARNRFSLLLILLGVGLPSNRKVF